MSKQWRCIDFVILRQRDRRMCVDVAARRGAVCNTDHNVVCARLCLKQGSYARRVPVPPRGGTFDVEKLASSPLREEYQEQVTEKAGEAWPEEEGMEEKWKAVSCTTISSAEDLLGIAGHSKPNWFHDFLEELKPLLRLKNEAYTKWLRTGRQEDHSKFNVARCNARQAVRRVNNIWFQEKA